MSSASASQTNPPSISPEVTACVKSLNDLEDRIRSFKSALEKSEESADSSDTLINFFLDHAISNGGFEYINTGFQDAVTKCKSVTQTSEDERVELWQAYGDSLKATHSYLGEVIALLSSGRELDIIQARPYEFIETMGKLLKEQSENSQLLKNCILKLIPVPPYDMTDPLYFSEKVWESFRSINSCF